MSTSHPMESRSLVAGRIRKKISRRVICLHLRKGFPHYARTAESPVSYNLVNDYDSYIIQSKKNAKNVYFVCGAISPKLMEVKDDIMLGKLVETVGRSVLALDLQYLGTS